MNISPSSKCSTKSISEWSSRKRKPLKKVCASSAWLKASVALLRLTLKCRVPCKTPTTNKSAMDTVILKIQKPYKFRVANVSYFLPELRKREFKDLTPTEKQSTRMYLRAFRFEPPYEDAYLPKIVVFEALNEERNAVLYTLQATFSVPKLLFGNSVEEVSDNDLDRVISAFRKALSGAGIEIESAAIANARVITAHFCKNILLPRNIRMQEILAELKRIDISKAVDITQMEYKNGGQVLHAYSLTVSRVFYDKVQDATRTKAKRKDKGRMGHERALIDRYGLGRREIFRYEYRLKKNQTLKSVVNKALGRPYQTPILLKDLFAPSLCKTVVLKSWHDLIERPENQLALIGPTDDLTLLLHLMDGAHKKSAAHSMNRAFISYGLTLAIRDHGAKEVRRAVSAIWNKDHGERLTNKMKEAAALAAGLPYSNSVAFLEGELERYQLITPSFLETAV